MVGGVSPSGSPPLIVMMKATNLGGINHGPLIGGLDNARLGAVHLER